MNLSQIRQEATLRLREGGKDYSKLVLINAAVIAAASLLLMLVSWLLQYVAPGGGLSNMDTRNLLETAQILLRLFCVLAVPFWDAGLIYCTLRLLGKQRNTSVDLLEGFRRWGPIASSLLIQGVIYFFILIFSFFTCSILFSMLPFPGTVYEELIAFTENPALPVTDDIGIILFILLFIYFVNLCALMIPSLYLHRQVGYRIMDDETCLGLQAVMHSRTLMKGNRRKLFLLDLSFWWFYLLEIGISTLAAGNLILEELGIVIPLSAETASWVFPIVALLARLVLYWLVKPRISLTYGLFYRNLYENSLKEPEPPKPKRKPWKY